MTLKLGAQQENMQDWLADPWLRSQGAGLTEACLPEEMRLDRGALEQRNFHHKQLIELVENHALPLFSQLMSHTSSRLILSDCEGYVLCHW
ncbi:sigma-54 dependent transcriptional regulator [Shewanella benthica KT99]|uniref:Sigma-54 dependent transcriptional regulator n=1 Tax=Shewanella benthica KT99 TaxID=314608 RepID=A9CXQ9_9GAMM|nr:sigma-54 dependent transcriptional regulator [Shewanella benthica KT99]